MFPYALLLLTLNTLTTVEASLVSHRTGKTTLSLMMNINNYGDLSIVEKDRARLLAMMQAGQPRKRNGHAITVNNTGIVYTAEVGIGNPPTNYTLLVDTGSGNTWVGAGMPYVQTKTSRNTGHAIEAGYGIGNFSGMMWNDTVTLSPDLVIYQQSIGVANSSYGFSEFDGMLGVGPAALSRGTVSGIYEVPTVTNNLYSQRTISEEVLGAYFIPVAEQKKYGELMFGGYDESVTIGDVVYVPLTTERNASLYWGIRQSISYGGETIMSSTVGAVDTGSTFIYLATDTYKKYQVKTGATFDNATGLLTITPEQYEKLEPLVFHIGGTPFPLIPNAQIWPRSLNYVIGGSADAIYLVFSDLGAFLPSNYGIDFFNGYPFLERYYSIYDTTKKRVGLAATAYTSCQVN